MHAGKLLRGPVHLGGPHHSIEWLACGLEPRALRGGGEPVERSGEGIAGRHEAAVVGEAEILCVELNAWPGLRTAAGLVAQTMRRAVVDDLLILVHRVHEP